MKNLIFFLVVFATASAFGQIEQQLGGSGGVGPPGPATCPDSLTYANDTLRLYCDGGVIQVIVAGGGGPTLYTGDGSIPSGTRTIALDTFTEIYYEFPTGAYDLRGIGLFEGVYTDSTNAARVSFEPDYITLQPVLGISEDDSFGALNINRHNFIPIGLRTVGLDTASQKLVIRINEVGSGPDARALRTISWDDFLSLSGGARRDVVLTEVDSNVTATKFSTLPVDCTGASRTIAPPAAPSAGDWFVVVRSRSGGANTVTITTTTDKLFGAAADVILTDLNPYAKLVYVNLTVGWISHQ